MPKKTKKGSHKPEDVGIFIGIADHARSSESGIFPYGASDFFGLSQAKDYVIYPNSINSSPCIFAIKTVVLDNLINNEVVIELIDGSGGSHGSITMAHDEEKNKQLENAKKDPKARTITSEGIEWLIMSLTFPTLIPAPGKYYFRLRVGDAEGIIGKITFFYSAAAPLTDERIKAIESDPLSAKMVRVVLSCNKCDDKLFIHSALDKKKQLNKNNHIWQHEAEDAYQCTCGSASFSLQYIKESLHGLLGRDFSASGQPYKFERRYSHSIIVTMVDKFNSLLESTDDEKPFQEYIEENLPMLARFRAIQIFVKPNILGKFEPDFAVLDTQKRLVLVELERPKMKLFKKDGHPTAKLMHAYGQVTDWMNEIRRHRHAVLDGLDLLDDMVMSVCGCVIAGCSSKENKKYLQRHLSNPPYPNIEFLTLEELSSDLIQLSKDLS